jgi:hypothetical protein
VALWALLAISGASQPSYRHFHQPLGGKADHPAQEISIRVFSISVRRFIVSSVIEGFLESGWHRNPTLSANPRWPPQNRVPLHHHLGHDPGAPIEPSFTLTSRLNSRERLKRLNS